MEQEVLKTIKYFSFFEYSPRFEEILAFLNRQTTPNNLQKVLKSLIRQNRLSEKDNQYTLGEYSKLLSQQKTKAKISDLKIKRLATYLRFLKLFPQVRLVGLSGSVSMLNAKKDDDIDLFVITGRNRLWTGRLICLLLASLFGRRKFRDRHTSDKICLNLFFDEGRLQIDPKKRSFYVAHEVLQMKPLIDRENVYGRFLEANKWVFKLFPNATKLTVTGPVGGFLPPVLGKYPLRAVGSLHLRHPSPESAFFEHLHSKKLVYSRQRRSIILNSIEDLIESILKRAQLLLINRHRTTEMITDTQLWFFPNDFEKKINSFLSL